MPAPRFLKLARPLAQNTSSDPTDVYGIKTLLADLGVYETPDWGMTGLPDRALFDAIRAYQKAHGLKVDGVMKPGGETEVSLRTLQTRSLQAQAEALRSKGRFGDTILAHISPAEVRLLDAVTDGGSINPATGLPEFWDQSQSSGGVVHVDAYTQDRNGTSTSISSHTRSVPGTGSAGNSVSGVLPTSPPLPSTKIRDDLGGKGHYKARRTGPDGKIYEHQGVDLEAKPGIPVTAPADGTVEVRKIYRDGRYNNEYENIVVKTESGTEYSMGYVTNKDENGKPVVRTGDRIKTGERIGTTQDRARQDKSGTMKNHIHFTKKVNGEFVDPTQDINSWEEK